LARRRRRPRPGLRIPPSPLLSTSLQPVAETRAKQSALWRDLALAYGAAQKAFILATDDDSPLWANPAIDRALRWGG